MSGVYFEFTYQGAYVKVAAIDADTGLEISIVGPVEMPQSELQKLALKKLDFVRKRATEEDSSEADETNETGSGRIA